MSAIVGVLVCIAVPMFGEPPVWVRRIMIIAFALVLVFLAGYALRMHHERKYHEGSLEPHQVAESLIPYLGRAPDDPGVQ